MDDNGAVAEEAGVYWVGTEVQVKVAALEVLLFGGVVNDAVFPAQVAWLAG